MGLYIESVDVEAVFGVYNVQKWANLDNDQAVDVSGRVTAAINWAEAYVNSRFRRGPYIVPFSGPGVAYEVKDWCAKLAGWWLYRSRGFRDQDQQGDLIEQHRATVESEMTNVLGGQRVLDLARNERGNGPDSPFVVL
jgi:hypothetical protein